MLSSYQFCSAPRQQLCHRGKQLARRIVGVNNIVAAHERHQLEHISRAVDIAAHAQAMHHNAGIAQLTHERRSGAVEHQ